MSPRFERDATSVTSNIPVLPKGDYELTVGEPKTFHRQNSKGDDTYGIMYPLTVVEPSEYTGKRIFFNAYAHTDGALAFGKRLILAALGYANGRDDDEDRFNKEYKGADWSFDTDTGQVGEMWMLPQGNRIIAELDTQPNQNRPDQPMQQFGNFRSLAGE